MSASVGYPGLLDCLDALTEVLRLETEALRHHDYDGFARLQADKQSLARQYEQQLKALAENPSAASAPDDLLRERLRAAQDSLSDILNENVITLDRARQSGERVVELIVGAARRAVTAEPRPYGNVQEEFRRGSMPVMQNRPISVDTQL